MTTKFKVKQPGVFFATKDGEQEVRVGEVITLDSKEVPAYLVGKGEIVGESNGKELVTNDELLAEADKQIAELSDQLKKSQNEAALAKTENEKLAAEIAELKKKLAK